MEGVGAPRWEPWVQQGHRTSGSYHDRQLCLWLKSHQADALTERKSVCEGTSSR